MNNAIRLQKESINIDRNVLEDVIGTAKRCSQFSMCKIDFISTGVCKPGTDHKYNAYFPQGRMELVCALYDGAIPVTQELIKIAESCILCNICRKQCYFSMELDSYQVMKALKDFVQQYVKDKKPIFKPNHNDKVLKKLQEVVGEKWVSNDLAIRVTYSKVRSPLVHRVMPEYVALPSNEKEIAQIMKLGKEYNLPVMPRGNGTSFFGALTKGIVIDLIRLKSIKIDKDNWFAEIGAGITAFKLQNEAYKNGLRANTAEPAACVCANVVSTNLHSLYSYSYGMGADNFIDATVIDENGTIYRLNEQNSPNFYSIKEKVENISDSPIICTSLKVKLFPLIKEEETVLIPFENLADCISLAKELSIRRIGFAAGIIGNEYLSNFISPTIKNANKIKSVLENKLGIKHLLILVCDKTSLEVVKKMTDVVISNDIVELLQYNLSTLSENQGLDVMSEIPGNQALYKEIFREDMIPVLKMSMSSTKESIINSVDKSMKLFFQTIYSNPNITDLNWLTTFRISSARIGRGNMFIPKIMWIPLDKKIIKEIIQKLEEVGDKYDIKNDFGYLVPVEFGKRAVMEFDYYYDHSDPSKIPDAIKAINESDNVLKKIQTKFEGITLGSDISSQGLSRHESYLYTTKNETNEHN